MPLPRDEVEKILRKALPLVCDEEIRRLAEEIVALDPDWEEIYVKKVEGGRIFFETPIHEGDVIKALRKRKQSG